MRCLRQSVIRRVIGGWSSATVVVTVVAGWLTGVVASAAQAARAGRIEASGATMPARSMPKHLPPFGSITRPRPAALIALCVLAGATAVMAGAVPASASTSTQIVPGTRVLFAVACPSATTCVAVGQYASQQEVVVLITNGVPGSAQAVPGTTELAGVACPSVTTCVAVGNNSGSGGVVVPIINGTPGTPQTVPGTNDLDGVGCASTTACYAVGRNPSDQGVVVPVTNGSPGSAEVVAGSWGNAGVLIGVACPSVTTCEAVGAKSSSGPGVVVPITGGTPGSLQAVAGTRDLEGVACPSATTCEAVGASSSSGPGVVVPIIGGTPGSPQAVAGTTELFGVACPRSTICEAAGIFQSASGNQGVMLPITGGTPGSVQAVAGAAEFLGVACPGTTTCEAVGLGLNGTGVVASFATIQTLVSLTFDNGSISQYTLGYQQALQPHSVKANFFVNSGVMGGTNHMSWPQLSTLASAGDEIGGKTVDGTNLTTLTAQQQINEICNDRQTLTQHGLKPFAFAYPAGAFNTTIETEVQTCGYGNARTAGSLSPAGPTYAQALPPKNVLALQAYAPAGQATLANLETLVTGAASHGGGWVPIVIQKVCSQTLDPANYTACTSASGWIDLADLNTFVAWVQNAGPAGGAPAGTTFSTIGAAARSADTSAPATTISCNGAPCASSPYGGTVNVTLAATDTGSGVASTHYTTDGTTPTPSSPTYTGSFPLTATATVQYRSWDNAGNVEAAQSQAIQI
jgi:peptidoglycan/xylan/chitin deacetylase (PgdA/CDA1 family)